MTNKAITPETGNPHSDPASGITSQSAAPTAPAEPVKDRRQLVFAYRTALLEKGSLSLDSAAGRAAIEAEEALLAAIAAAPQAAPTAPAEPQPVEWQFKHYTDPDTDWKKLIPRTDQTLESALAEIRGYVRLDGRQQYDVRALYAAAPQAEPQPLSDEQCDSVIAEMGLTYLTSASDSNRSILRTLCRRAHGIGTAPKGDV